MTEDNQRRRSVLPLVIGLPLIAVVAAVAIFFTTSGGRDEANVPPPSQEDNSREQTASPSTTPETGELGTPTLGRDDAPVVMMEFSDFQ